MVERAVGRTEDWEAEQVVVTVEIFGIWYEGGNDLGAGVGGVGDGVGGDLGAGVGGEVVVGGDGLR